MSRSPLEQYISPETRRKYALWIAQYSSKCTYNDAYGMWQFSPNGMLTGHKVYFDLNECNVDYPALMKERGLNGYAKEVKPAPVEDNYKYLVVIDQYDTYDEAQYKLKMIKADHPRACIKKIKK